MKKCGRCNTLREESEFSYKNKKKQVLSSYCKSCNKKYQQHHYLSNVNDYKVKRTAHRVEYRQRNRKKIMEYLSCHPCVDCGESDPVVLEFDHVTGKKVANLANMLHDLVRWERIKAEIQLCEVRCANCHKRRTSKQFNWSKANI